MPSVRTRVKPEAQITEITEFEAHRIDGVKKAANGFPILMLKAVNPSGGIDEGPDIDGAEHILQLLARLIQSEASEMAVGAWDESRDIRLLIEAVDCMTYFRAREQAGDVDDGLAKEALNIFKAHRKFTSDERKSLAGEGNALPDGSYPIPDKDALRRAAILARSGHGDVAAARRLISKRAKELGVPNPLANDAAKDVTEETPAVIPDGEDRGTPDVDALVKEAVAEASKAHGEAIEELRGELAKVKATAIPGGPALTAPPSLRAQRQDADHLAKAIEFERQAEMVSEPEIKRYYLDRARRARSAMSSS